MAHSLHILVLSLGLAFTACDNAEQAKVPLEGGRGLGPAKIEARQPQPDASTEAIVAWVNEEPILESTLDERVQRMRGPEHQAQVEGRRAGVLQRLIDERLVEQWLRTQETSISEEDIDAAIERATRDVHGGRDALLAYLDDRGMTLDRYRQQVRRELAEAALLAGEEVPEDVLAELYRDVANRPASLTMFELSSVLVPAETDQSTLLAVDTEAKFRRLPGRHSDLGWVERDALGEPLARALLAVTAPGGTKPMSTPAGTELYWVGARKEQPTEHFIELQPMLRQRAQQIAIGRARVDLVRRLRENGEVRLASATER